MIHQVVSCLILGTVLAAAGTEAYAQTQLRGAYTPSPTWPNVFQASFNETLDYVIFKGHTNGTMYYNWNVTKERTDRQSGKYDRYCGLVISKDTPCTHLVVDGVRYLNFPQENYCCKCCTDKGGCGVLKPNWIEASNGTYQGRSYVDGHEVDGWKIKGLQDNYWYQTTSNGAPVQLVQEPDATRDFDVSSYSVGSLPDHIFDVPAGCDEKCSKKAPLSVCATLD
eukprot:gb/GECG01002959.1/.p1 GENE.gb/GECG01002959.1/~~gb/GECG01002959.1/.p1  ORF type:complete len:224 (+),score=15.34 gb/GECG01002959.1/:1-672(+)